MWPTGEKSSISSESEGHVSWPTSLPANGSKPFGAGGEGCAELTVTPAHRALALRAQGRAQACGIPCTPPPGVRPKKGGTRVVQGVPLVPEGNADLAEDAGAMAEYAPASRGQMEKVRKCDHL